MRIRLLSDLHLEFTPFTLKPAKADITVLAGDLACHTPLAQARLAHFLSELEGPAVYVAGNHEYYGHFESVDYIQSALRQTLTAFPNVKFLDRDRFDFGGYSFLGCTLWTDFTMVKTSQRLGQPITPEQARTAAATGISDFHVVVSEVDAPGSGVKRLIIPDTMAAWHARDRAWLDREIAQAELESRKVVVVTHFLPHPVCVAPKYFGSTLNPYFCTDCGDLMREPVKAWLHGHTHCSVSTKVNDVLIECNPRGCTYLRQKLPENEEFKSIHILELP